MRKCNESGCSVWNGKDWVKEEAEPTNKKKMFFANNRAIIEGQGSEVRYILDGEEVDLRTFDKFIKGETLSDGRHRKEYLSEKKRYELDMQELRYWLSDSSGEVDHVDPMTRRVEELKSEMAQRKLDDKVIAIEKATEDAKVDAQRKLEEEYFEIRLELLEKERRAKAEVEAEKRSLADEEKRRHDFYTYGY